jgi:predicted lipoprotein with Yx(FWY)xxD motif
MIKATFFRAAGLVLASLFVLGPGAASLAAAPGAGPVTLQLVKNDQLGSFLVDGAGNTLYMFTKDTKGVTNCYGNCAQAWPPLLTDGQQTVAKDGVSAALVGTVSRTDGTTQVTYNGWPLYYYVKDMNAGDTTGQAVGKVWWVVSSEGFIIKPAALKVAQDPKYGQFLADDQGNSLYMFTKDTTDQTNCYGNCAQAWPPLLTAGPVTLGDGLNQSLLGTTKRKDGTTQVTYKGWPLYYYIKDMKSGDVTGQDVGKVWYLVAPNGEIIKNSM